MIRFSDCTKALVATCLVVSACGDDGDGQSTPATTSSGTAAVSMTPPAPLTTSGADTSTGGGSSSSDSGSSSTGEPGLGDIDMEAVVGEIGKSVYTQTVTFEEDSCAVEEACILDVGARRLLRFDTWTPNVGESDIVVGSPEENPELFEYGKCHAHFHFLDFANYRILSDKGEVVATGHKQSFALIDFERFLPDSGPGKYPFPDGTQGISAGWADIYGAYLDCQWVDITDVPPGDYILEIAVDQEERLTELTHDNNIALVPITIGIEDDVGPRIPPPDEWTCPDVDYAADDSCHCGCGAVDPDCDNPTVRACENCGAPGACSMDCDQINAANNAVCD